MFEIRQQTNKQTNQRVTSLLYYYHHLVLFPRHTLHDNPVELLRDLFTFHSWASQQPHLFPKNGSNKFTTNSVHCL